MVKRLARLALRSAVKIAPLAAAVAALALIGSACGSNATSPQETTGTVAQPVVISMVEVLTYAHEAGLLCDNNLVIAGAVAHAESSLDTDAKNCSGNSPPSCDRGLWQINSYWHPEVSDSCAFDALCNAQAMVSISNGGTQWSPWAAYNANKHLQFMDEAQAAYDQVCSPVGCDPNACSQTDRICCPGSNACIDANSDTSNCGSCGVSCSSGDSCVSGSCTPQGCNASSCASYGKVCCPGSNACVDTDSDTANCGSCGHACSWGDSCANGSCSALGCDANSCSSYDMICCAGLVDCVDPWSDPSNCGSCGNTCSWGETCIDGTCKSPQCDAGACSSWGLSCCPGDEQCVDLFSDPANCGTCGTMCASSQACVQGTCTSGASCEPAVCAAWGAICCGPNAGCVDPTTDESNCGGCGFACNQGEACMQGTCSGAAVCTPSACPAGFVCCPGSTSCHNVQLDPWNCGACGTVCPQGQGCSQGSCTAAIPGDCDPAACASWGGLCCPGASGCVDPMNDPVRCGGCSQGCRYDERCSKGSCVPDHTPDGGTASDGGAGKDAAGTPKDSGGYASTDSGSQGPARQFPASESSGCSQAAGGPGVGFAYGLTLAGAMIVARQIRRRRSTRKANASCR